MKRKEIADILKTDPNTEFAVARYGRTDGIDAGNVYYVTIKTADPATRRIRGQWSSHDEAKPTGVEVFLSEEDGVGYYSKKGDRSVVQPQDIVATRADYEARRKQVAEYNETRKREADSRRAQAQEVADNLMNATGFVGARLMKNSFGNYSIDITLEMAQAITEYVRQS